MLFNKKALLDLLPYGGGFLFVDEAKVENSLGGLIFGEGYYQIPSPEENQIMRDHFFGQPIFPGHLQMEALAQLGAVIFIAGYNNGDDSVFPLLMSSSFELKTIALPGDILSLKASVSVNGKTIEVVGEIGCRSNVSKGVIKGIAIPTDMFSRMVKRKEKRKQQNQT